MKKQDDKTVKVSKEAYAILSLEKKTTKIPFIHLLDRAIKETYDRESNGR